MTQLNKMSITGVVNDFLTAKIRLQRANKLARQQKQNAQILLAMRIGYQQKAAQKIGQ